MPIPPAIGDAAEVRASLIGAAAAGHSLTYSELCVTLGVVDREGAARGEPELAVLVVRQSDGLPGQGWWVDGGARSHGYDGPWEGPEAAAFIARLQRVAFDYWASHSP
jgi:hypothetical protein